MPSSDPGDARVAAWDGVRGVAILMVVFWHFYACVPRPEWVTTVPLLETVAAYGWTGVPLFFVLSGFLIARLLVARREKPGYYAEFFIKRGVRIMPVYLLSLAVYLVVRLLLPTDGQHPLARFFATDAPLWMYPLLVQNFVMATKDTFSGEWLSVTWSLAVEVQFYLLAPLLVAAARPRYLPVALLGIVAFAVGFRWFIFEHQLVRATALIVLLPSRIDGFALGMLAGVVTGLPPAHRMRIIAAGGILALMAAVHTLRHDAAIYAAMLYLMLSAIFCLGLLHLRSSPAGRVQRLLSFGPVAWCGSVSYFVYLFHQPANHFVHYTLSGRTPNLADPSGLGLTLLSVALVFAVAEVSRRHLERPLIGWGKRMAAAMRLRLAPGPSMTSG